MTEKTTKQLHVLEKKTKSHHQMSRFHAKIDLDLYIQSLEQKTELLTHTKQQQLTARKMMRQLSNEEAKEISKKRFTFANIKGFEEPRENKGTFRLAKQRADSLDSVSSCESEDRMPGNSPRENIPQSQKKETPACPATEASQVHEETKGEEEPQQEETKTPPIRRKKMKERIPKDFKLDLLLYSKKK